MVCRIPRSQVSKDRGCSVDNGMFRLREIVLQAQSIGVIQRRDRTVQGILGIEIVMNVFRLVGRRRGTKRQEETAMIRMKLMRCKQALYRLFLLRISMTR